MLRGNERKDIFYYIKGWAISKIGYNQGLVERGSLLSLLSDKEERAIELLKEFANESVVDELAMIFFRA